ncbi:uncharacterized protein LOC144886426 [Branchiostoma floridae x Branchiostoma japonicum]
MRLLLLHACIVIALVGNSDAWWGSNKQAEKKETVPRQRARGSKAKNETSSDSWLNPKKEDDQVANTNTGEEPTVQTVHHFVTGTAIPPNLYFSICPNDINECNESTYKRGHCVSQSGGGYKCTCSPGWTGQNCQQDINECTRNPCQHGQCVNQDGGYKCTCEPGWTGQNCQQDINECTRNPCQHGSCVNQDGGYKCTCEPGWTGQNCQEDIDECTGDPCQHGQCVNQDGGYKCTCSPGWTGQNCQQAKQCQSGWREHNNHCYKLMQNKASWSSAESMCKTDGASLASITSSDENNFIKDVISNARVGVWIGLHKKGKSWKWADGSGLSYTNWDQSESRDRLMWYLAFGARGQCANMNSTTGRPWFYSTRRAQGKWAGINCDMKYNFICKKTKDVTSQSM